MSRKVGGRARRVIRTATRARPDSPRHTDLALLRRIAFGHLIAAFALEGGSAHVIEQALERSYCATLGYIHRNSLSKPEVRTYEEQLEAHGLRVVREADLLTDRDDES